MEDLIDIFVSTLGEPINKDALIDYISFCIDNNDITNMEEYCELHHMFPRSTFEELSSISEFIVRLKYLDHVTAHSLLVQAYPIRPFIHPLNFMAKTDEEKEIRRQAHIKCNEDYWDSLKNDVERYAVYIKKLSDYKKEFHGIGSDHHKKVCAGVQLYYENNPQRKEELSKFWIEWWSSLHEERYKEECVKRAWKTSSNYEDRCNDIKNRYNDAAYMQHHIDVMTRVNKNDVKRETAGKTIKLNWTTDVYREKVRAGRQAAQDERVDKGEKRSNSKKMKEKWENPEFKRTQRNKRIANGQIKAIEYNGKIYYGWGELKEKTGVTEHFYKKWKKENETK